MFFEGDQHPLNPMRYLPTPFHTKFAQQRTALSQYIQQEAVGTRMRRWERPLHDFLLPYLRGAVARITGEDVIPEEVQHRRDLDTLVDMLQFLRAEEQAGRGYGKAAQTRSRAAVCTNLPRAGARAGRSPAPAPVPGQTGRISCFRPTDSRPGRSQGDLVIEALAGGKKYAIGSGTGSWALFSVAGVTDLPPCSVYAPGPVSDMF